MSTLNEEAEYNCFLSFVFKFVFLKCLKINIEAIICPYERPAESSLFNIIININNIVNLVIRHRIAHQILLGFWSLYDNSGDRRFGLWSLKHLNFWSNPNSKNHFFPFQFSQHGNMIPRPKF